MAPLTTDSLPHRKHFIVGLSIEWIDNYLLLAVNFFYAKASIVENTEICQTNDFRPAIFSKALTLPDTFFSTFFDALLEGCRKSVPLQRNAVTIKTIWRRLGFFHNTSSGLSAKLSAANNSRQAVICVDIY